MLTFLLRWWWPFFALVYPLLWWPFGSPSRLSSILLHMGFTLVWVIGGLLLELACHPETGLSDVRRLPGWLRRNPAALIAILYGVWVLFAAAFSPDPAAAYVGSAYDQTDGAVWVALLIVVFLLGYVRSQQDVGVATRIAWGVVWACAVLSVLSLWEVVTGHGVVYAIQSAEAPTVNFPQKGHLAGMLVMGAAAALALPRAWPVLLIIGVALGTTVNRAAFVALAGVAVWELWRNRRAFLIPAVVAALGIIGGWSLVQSAQGGQTKEVASGGSLISRTYFWRVSIKGIIDRPVFGWGGGQFYRSWVSVASKEDLAGFVKYELGENLEYRSGNVIFTRDRDGKLKPRYYNSWKSHNEFLEQALIYGIPSALLYIFLIIYSFTRRRNEAALTAICAINLFFLLWFSIPEIQGAMWLLWSCVFSAAPNIARNTASGLGLMSKKRIETF